MKEKKILVLLSSIVHRGEVSSIATIVLLFQLQKRKNVRDQKVLQSLLSLLTRTCYNSFFLVYQNGMLKYC